jgi:hypothetical protein
MAAALGEKADRLEAETTMGVSFRVELEGAGWEWEVEGDGEGSARCRGNLGAMAGTVSWGAV